MGVFEHFPYSNFHEMNMDWILERLGKIMSVEESERVKLEIEQLYNDIAEAATKAVTDAETAGAQAVAEVSRIAATVAADREESAKQAANAELAAIRAENAANTLDDVSATVENIVDEKVSQAMEGIDVGYVPDEAIILTEGLHYGNQLPQTVTPGRLFFVKVG